MMADHKTARLAGLLYLIVVVTGMFSLVFVPSRINVANDPAATVANILAFDALFRAGIAAFLVKQVAFALLPLALYRLLRPVDATKAMLMVVLAVVSVPIALVGLAHRLDALSWLTEPAFATVLTQAQRHAEAALSLRSYNNALFVTNVFWGLWLLPFGLLVIRSSFLPSLLGALLVLGGLGYVANVFGELFVPGFALTTVAKVALMPAALGEIGTCFWLLIAGARPGFRAAK